MLEHNTHLALAEFHIIPQISGHDTLCTMHLRRFFFGVSRKLK